MTATAGSILGMCVPFTRDVISDSVIHLYWWSLMNAETRRSSFLMTCLCVKPDKDGGFFFFSFVLKGTSA